LFLGASRSVPYLIVLLFLSPVDDDDDEREIYPITC